MSEHTVEELEEMLAAAKAKRDHKEYPKWIEPHESHIERQGDHVSVALFDHHVDRKGVVTVLVKDEEHEAKAKAAKESV